jgi:hypothetical protein
MIAVPLSDFLHKECKEWLSQLDLYFKELGIFNSRLKEVVERNSSEGILKQVEHFQNQFILQQEALETLRHEISVHDQTMARELEAHKILDEQDYPGDQFDLRHKIFMQEKLFRELKHEFYNFLGKVL